MENINTNDLIKEIEKTKDKIANVRAERNMYLGEYRERVIVALTKEELSEKFIYPEVIKALKKKLVDKLIISRDIDLSKIKKYIKLAQSMKVPFKMVDGLSYIGDVGLVVVSDEALKNVPNNPIPLSFKERILEAGLDEVYYKALGKKIDKDHYNIIEEKLPELAPYYDKITFFDRLTGTKCIISEKLDN